MIDEIQVENLALIRKAALEPARGLTVLTGETGAGKTALLSALKLLMGERADKAAVRDGADALFVAGRFFGKFRAAGAVDAEEGETGEGETVGADGETPLAPTELVATRRVAADGRSRVTIDGRMASVGELAAAVAPTVDLCGQHEHQQLMKPAVHVRLLDALGVEKVPYGELDMTLGAIEAARRGRGEGPLMP